MIVEEINNLASVFTSPIRVSIIQLLLKNSCNVSDLVETLKIEQAVISKQLGILKKNGFLKCTPEGRCRVYQIANNLELNKLFDLFTSIHAQAIENSKKCKADKHLIDFQS